MESASADDVRARGSPKGLVLAPLQAQAQHYPKGEGWKRSQFGSRKRSQTDRQTDAPTTTTLIASGPPLRGDPYFVCISTTLLRNDDDYDAISSSNCGYFGSNISTWIEGESPFLSKYFDTVLSIQSCARSKALLLILNSLNFVLFCFVLYCPRWCSLAVVRGYVVDTFINLLDAEFSGPKIEFDLGSSGRIKSRIINLPTIFLIRSCSK